METNPETKTEETVSSPDKPLNKKEVLDKRARLGKIFQMIMEGPACTNPEEANRLVESSFKAVEDEFAADEHDRMGLYGLQFMFTSVWKGKTIYHERFKRHVLFIGENGSINVRVKKDDEELQSILATQPSYPKDNMKSLLEKPGADGLNVWD